MPKRLLCPRAGAAAVLATVLIAGLASGCSAGHQEPGADPAAGSPSGAASTAAPPAGSRSLRDLGFQFGPEQAVYVPPGAVLADRVDQKNVVTLVFSAPAGPELVAFYAQTLPGAGFTITGRSADSLVFTGPEWDGSFTSVEGLAGLTLRRHPA